MWVLMMVIALGSTPIAEFKTKEDCEKMSVEFSTKFKNEKYICELKKIEKKAYSVNASSYESFKIRRVENGKEQ